MQYKGHTIQTKKNSHCALIFKGSKLVKCVAGDIKNGSHNATDKAKAFIDNIK